MLKLLTLWVHGQHEGADHEFHSREWDRRLSKRVGKVSRGEELGSTRNGRRAGGPVGIVPATAAGIEEAFARVGRAGA
jgi:hypothetical protein